MLARLRVHWTLGFLLLGAGGLVGCGLVGCGKALGREASSESSPVSKPVAVVEAPQPGGPMTRFEAGRARAGSVPGTPLRDPTREADLVPVTLAAYQIDRGAFPNDPAKPELTINDYASASAACAANGKRLCNELEWEHACTTAGAAAFGAKGREWVLSEGSDPNANTRDATRCGARTLNERTAQLGFRCCRGAEAQPAYPVPSSNPSALGARPLQVSTEDIRKALAGVPELAALAPQFEPYTTSDADAALRRGKRSRDGITAWTLLPSVVAWTPAAGDDLVIVAGRSGDQGVIAVLYPLGDGGYAHAASAILREPDTSVALAQRVESPTPTELLWTSCYGCPNEGGAIRYGDDRRVVIEFR